MILLYTKSYCPYCIKAKNLLEEVGASFQEIDITNDPDTLQEIAQKSNMRTVPQIWVDETCLGGYSDILALHEKNTLLQALQIENL